MVIMIPNDYMAHLPFDSEFVISTSHALRVGTGGLFKSHDVLWLNVDSKRQRKPWQWCRIMCHTLSIVQ